MLAKRLKSALRLQIASLFLKSVLFALLLGLVNYSESLWWIGALGVYGIYLYWSSIRPGAYRLGFSFTLFYILSFILAGTLQLGSYTFLVFVACGGLLFLLLGVCGVYFKNLERSFAVFFYTLVFLCLSWATHAFIVGSWWAIIALFFFILILWREYIRVVMGTFNRRFALFGLVLSLIMCEAVVVFSVLSSGFLIASALALVLFVSLSDGALDYFSGKILARSLLERGILLALFSALLFLLFL